MPPSSIRRPAVRRIAYATAPTGSPHADITGKSRLRSPSLPPARLRPTATRGPASTIGASHLPSPISHLPSPISRLASRVSRLASPASHLPSPVSRLPSRVRDAFLNPHRRRVFTQTLHPPTIATANANHTHLHCCERLPFAPAVTLATAQTDHRHFLFSLCLPRSRRGLAPSCRRSIAPFS
ncbi:protein of unknown function [Burkholderia multivorans]